MEEKANIQSTKLNNFSTKLHSNIVLQTTERVDVSISQNWWDYEWVEHKQNLNLPKDKLTFQGPLAKTDANLRRCKCPKSKMEGKLKD